VSWVKYVVNKNIIPLSFPLGLEFRNINLSSCPEHDVKRFIIEKTVNANKLSIFFLMISAIIIISSLRITAIYFNRAVTLILVNFGVMILIPLVLGLLGSEIGGLVDLTQVTINTLRSNDKEFQVLCIAYYVVKDLTLWINSLFYNTYFCMFLFTVVNYYILGIKFARLPSTMINKRIIVF